MMGLRKASSYFARSKIEAWNGVSWMPTCNTGAVQPHDRFLSDREYGQRLRYMLVDPEKPLSTSFAVIRMKEAPQVNYLVGNLNYDLCDGVYSLIYLLHIAPAQVSLINIAQSTRASGVGAVGTPTSLGTFHADIQRITVGDMAELHGSRITDYNIYLPKNCPVNVDHELQYGTTKYVITEVFETSGFKTCRGLIKHA